MSDPKDRVTKADREAAEWFARLGRRSITNAELSEFEAWRRAPDNLDAYNRVEAVWQSADRLARDPDILKVAQDALDRKPKTRKVDRRTITWLGIGVIGAGAAAAVGLTFIRPGMPDAYSTRVGQQLPITLADGSSIRLDTDSALRVRYEKGRRVILLDRGQALFNVAHDASRPFIVQAGDTSVTALGTVFDVRRGPADVRVTLVTGSVAVRDAGTGGDRNWRLAPGGQVRIEPKAAKVSTVDGLTATSWSQGQLIFRDTPLVEAIAEVNRYLPHKIVLADASVRDVRVNGVFNTGDRDAFVSAVSEVMGLTGRPQTDGSIRLVTAS